MFKKRNENSDSLVTILVKQTNQKIYRNAHL